MPVPLGMNDVDLFELEDFVVTPDETMFFSVNHASKAGLYRASSLGSTLLLAGENQAFGWLALGNGEIFASSWSSLALRARSSSRTIRRRERSCGRSRTDGSDRSRS